MASNCSVGLGQGGYKTLLKPPKTYKKLSRRAKLDNAREKVNKKLGELNVAEIQETFTIAQSTESDSGKLRADGVILTLLAQGLSQIEIITKEKKNT